jgi:hypothetical protein
LIADLKVHIDAQGFIPSLPDAHSVNFPVLALPTAIQDSTLARNPPIPLSSPTKLALIETFVHRLVAFSSVPVDLFIPPYSCPPLPLNNLLLPPRIGRIALHPSLPIVALSHAHPGGHIFLFDLRTNTYLKYKLALENTQQVSSLAFSKYNLLAAGMLSGEILLYELNLSVSASTNSKPLRLTATPLFISLIPPQFPLFALLGEITDLSFDHRTGRYLAIATTRSGTWVYDVVYSSPLRLSRHSSSSVAFSPAEDMLAVARERTGEIELYTLIRAGALTFSVPTLAKSGFKSTVTHLQWASNGKSLLYCNDGQDGIRVLNIGGQPLSAPGIWFYNGNAHWSEARYAGNIDTPLRATTLEGVPYGGNPTGFALDASSRRLIVSYSRSPLLEVFALSSIAEPASALSVGVLRGPSAGKQMSEKAKGKMPEGPSPFEEDVWARAMCVDMGFVGQVLGGSGCLFTGAWNGEEGGKVAFVAFHLEDIGV